VAGPRSLRRLLRVLEIEEEQQKLALETAVGELRLMERALAAAGERGRGGRHLIALSAHNGEMADRLAGLEESLGAARSLSFLKPRTASTQQEVSRLRDDLLAKRVAQQQTAHVLRGVETREAMEAARRGQQSLDEAHLRQMRREESKKERGTPRGGTEACESKAAKRKA
jgi:hypothetical protein